MKLIVTEKNIAAEKLAAILADTKPKKDKVYSTPVYRFTRSGEEWVAIGLKGHILETEFPTNLVYDAKKKSWTAVSAEGEVVPATMPENLAVPPFPSNRKPFSKEGVNIKDWSVPSLPYLVQAPVLMKAAEKELIRSLKNLAAKADEVVIATDFDREGELIGSDAMGIVREVNADVNILRARYSAITKDEIQRAFSSLTEVDRNLADAGDSRRQIDFIWGAALTRYLSKAKYTSMSSSRPAGRVQTPTLALIVDRERERQAFVPEDYWTIKGAFKAGETEFSAGHATARFKVEAEARAAMDAIEKADTATVVAVEKKPLTRPAPTPFNTSALQAAAASEGLSPARTMRIAESLYMNGLISYPRVDNTVYPPSLDLDAILKELSKVPSYAPHISALRAAGPLRATRGKKETTDHPPIHPTGAGDPDKMRPEEWKLYQLVARRFLATLSSASVAESTTVSLDVAGQPFTAKGEVQRVAGFRAIYPYGAKKDAELPSLEQGQVIAFLGAEFAAKQTEPPSRYSQGKLIQEMEARGLGTKATRHAMIERLYEVRYAQNDPVEPTALGMAIIGALEQFAPHITTPDMTAQLEAEMDQIAAGEKTEESVVGHSRNLLASVLEELIPRKEEFGSMISDAVDADAHIGSCPKCGKALRMKSSPKTRSNFIGCSGYPDCDVTYPVPKGKIASVEETCATCGAPQIKVTAFRSKPRVVCIDPACATNHEPDVIVGTCKVCAEAGREGSLVAQRSPRTLKRFIRCTNYELCDTSYPLPGQGKIVATGERCPSCEAPMVDIITARGPWHLCPNMDCPARAEAEAAKLAAAEAKGAGRSTAAKKPAARKTAAKKPAAKKAATKTTAAKKPATKKTAAKKVSE